MIILNRDGTLEWILADCRPGKTMTDSIVLPDDPIEQQSILFDRVFAFAFDVLGLVTVELRVRAAEQATSQRAERYQHQKAACRTAEAAEERSMRSATSALSPVE